MKRKNTGIQKKSYQCISQDGLSYAVVTNSGISELVLINSDLSHHKATASGTFDLNGDLSRGIISMEK